MKQVTFLAIRRLALYRQGFWGEQVTESQHAERLEHGKSAWGWLVHSFCVEGNPKSQQIPMVPCMFLMLPCMAFCGALLRVWQLQWSCVHAVQSVARGKCQKELQAYSRLGQGQMKADIASVVSLLMQQPRALQKHARLLVRMQKRILGQSPAVGTGCTMLNTQTSHAQRLKRQICSLWSSILISESLPLVIVVWRAVMATASPIVALEPDMGAVSELVGPRQRCWS